MFSWLTMFFIFGFSGENVSDEVKMGVPFVPFEEATEQIKVVQDMLDQIQPDRDTQRGLLEFLWYGLTRHKPKIMAFHIGIGYNGKSVVLEMWHVTLGGYSYYGGERLYGANADSTTLANMGGCRSVVLDDQDEKKPMSKSTTKSFTGSKFMNCRKLYSTLTEYENDAAFNCGYNEMPHYPDPDSALTRRYFFLTLFSKFSQFEHVKVKLDFDCIF